MKDPQVAKVHELLDNFDTVMLITQSRGQFAHARPMAVARLESDGGVWFLTGRTSVKVNEIKDESQVLIACQEGRSRFLSLIGTAELVSDQSKAREFWSEAYRTWFPGGPEDPNLVLIFVHPTEAEYWDNQGSNGIRYVFEAAKAYVTGTTPHIQEGQQHAKVEMEHGYGGRS